VIVNVKYIILILLISTQIPINDTRNIWFSNIAYW